MSPKRGRPSKPMCERRTEHISVRFTPRETDALCTLAVRQRKTLSDVIHEACERMFGPAKTGSGDAI